MEYDCSREYQNVMLNILPMHISQSALQIHLHTSKFKFNLLLEFYKIQKIIIII